MAGDGSTEQDILLKIHGYGGQQIPSAQLSSLATAIEALGSAKAPSTLSQKRSFIEDWFEERKGSFVPPPPPPVASSVADGGNSGYIQPGGHRLSHSPRLANAGMAELVSEVRRSYTSGATEQQLHQLASAVSVSSGVPMPGGGPSEWAEFVLVRARAIAPDLAAAPSEPVQ